MAVDEHVFHPARKLMRVVEHGLVAKALRVENDQIGEIMDLQIAALGQPQDVGWKPRATADRLFERQNLLGEGVMTDLPRKSPVAARVRAVAPRKIRPAVGSGGDPG